MADKLRVGIIGANPTAGWAARAHLPAFAAGVPGAELVAVSTTRQESADEAAKQFGAAHAFNDHRKLLALPDVDVVAVVVKLPMHYQLAKDAIEAGKHTYVEWPLATTTAQANELTDLAKQKGVRTAVGLQARRSAEYRHMGKLINDGYVGDVLSCTLIQFSGGALGRPSARMWMRENAAHANTLTIGFAHVLDGLMTAVGRLKSVSARVSAQVHEWTATDTGEKLPVDAPDDVLVSGELASGGSVAIHVASVARLGTGHRFEVHGTEGTLAIQAGSSPHARQVKVLGAQGDDPELKELDVPEDPWVGAAGLKGSAINIGKIWESFARSITEGSSGFDPDFGSALQHHQLLDAIQRASDTGQAQAV
jgi:predicted dehydrogenase